jgi:hypothetical protein
MTNEKRIELIDRNVLQHKMFYVEEKQGGHGWVISLEDLSKAPTVDAVEVVRCKDCKRWHKDTFSCDFMKYGTHVYQPNWYEEDFCSYGERKDNV